MAPPKAGMFFAALVCLGLGRLACADEPKKAAAERSLDDLMREVAALQTVHYLDLTPDQLKAIRKLAGETAGKAPVRDAAKGSEEFRQALVDLRQALVEPDDLDRIDELGERVDDLRETEKIDPPPEVEYTEEARRRVPEVIRLLTPRQAATFFAANADDLQDPLQRLLEALDKVRGLAPAKWKEYREELSDTVAGLVAGLDEEKASRVKDQIIQWLIVIRSLTEDEFKSQRPELEKKARQLVGDVGPTDVLRHYLEQAVVELLSNPRLPAALDARLK